MQLRVGMVGFGEIAQYHRRHLTAAGASVVGAVTTRETGSLTRYSTLAAMLPDVDAVTIAVPNHLHAALAADAVAAGKAVLVEKPLCVTKVEMVALERIIAASATPVHVALRLRFNPWVQWWRERREARREVRCTYRLGIAQLADGKPWTRRRAQSGGALFTLGVHALDIARWMARAGAQPLGDLDAEENTRGRDADFPLRARIRGRLSDGREIVAEADLRDEAPFALTLVVDRVALADGPPFPPPDGPGSADAEYAAMMRDFVAAAVSGERDADRLAGALQVHRDLLEATALLTGG